MYIRIYMYITHIVTLCIYLSILQDVSVPEAFPVTDFDESAIKSGFAEATKNSASDDAAIRATAQIELSVYTALARSLGISL